MTVAERWEALRGNDHAARALEIAKAGEHSIGFVTAYSVMGADLTPEWVNLAQAMGVMVKSDWREAELQIEIATVRPEDCSREPYERVRVRVTAAERRRSSGTFVFAHDGMVEKLLDRATRVLSLSAEEQETIKNVAKTIAALDGAAYTSVVHIAEAIQYVTLRHNVYYSKEE